MSTKYDELMSDPAFRKLMAEESLVAEVSEFVAQLMAERGIHKAELARRLGKSRAWVTQMLSGRANLTVRTLAEVVFVLGGEITVLARPGVPERKAPLGGKISNPRRAEVLYVEAK